jgi:hypothetical protein
MMLPLIGGEILKGNPKVPFVVIGFFGRTDAYQGTMVFGIVF